MQSLSDWLPNQSVPVWIGEPRNGSHDQRTSIDVVQVNALELGDNSSTPFPRMLGDTDTLVADERLARRLQEEENRQHGFPSPVLQGDSRHADQAPLLQRLGSQNGDNRAVHQNVVENLEEQREQSPRVFWCYMTIAAAEVGQLGVS